MTAELITAHLIRLLRKRRHFSPLSDSLNSFKNLTTLPVYKFIRVISRRLHVTWATKIASTSNLRCKMSLRLRLWIVIGIIYNDKKKEACWHDVELMKKTQHKQKLSLETSFYEGKKTALDKRSVTIYWTKTLTLTQDTRAIITYSFQYLIRSLVIYKYLDMITKQLYVYAFTFETFAKYNSTDHITPLWGLIYRSLPWNLSRVWVNSTYPNMTYEILRIYINLLLSSVEG